MIIWSFCIMIVLILLLLQSASGTVPSPPKVFWKWNSSGTYADPVFWPPKRSRSQSEKVTTANSLDYPALMWNYFDQKTLDRSPISQGSYFRDSPSSWKLPAITNESGTLVLGKRSRVSHGPRRKRSDLPSSRAVPLFCWRFLVNCKIFPKHICCPVMTKDGQKSKRDTQLQPNRKSPSREVDQEPEYLAKYGNQRWIPYSPAISGIRVRSQYQRRCQMNGDCNRNPDHVCCSFKDRVLPIGPFVQPSLLENWVSAFFDYFGKYPLSYFLLEQVVTGAIIVTLIITWTMLGRYLGFLPPYYKLPKTRRSSPDPDQSDKVLFTISEAKDWIASLDKKIGGQKTLSGMKDFLCCFIHHPRPDGGRLKCYSPNHTQRTTLQCISDMIYSVRMNKPLTGNKKDRD